jgi:hypothetical protein
MSTTLQTVVEHCMSYNKDPWTGPVRHDDGCPACAPSANTASANPSNAPAAYGAMEQVSFNYHLSRWRNSLLDLADKCVICHNLAQEKKHTMANAPFSRNLVLKLKRGRLRTTATNPMHVLHPRVLPLPHCLPPPPLPRSPTLGGGGSINYLGACTASTEAETYNSGDEFGYEGKYEGAFYASSVKPS